MGRPVTLTSVTVTFGKIAGGDVQVEVGGSPVASPGSLATFATVAAKKVNGETTYQASVYDVVLRGR
jgi:hypothetical protein